MIRLFNAVDNEFEAVRVGDRGWQNFKGLIVGIFQSASKIEIELVNGAGLSVHEGDWLVHIGDTLVKFSDHEMNGVVFKRSMVTYNPELVDFVYEIAGNPTGDERKEIEEKFFPLLSESLAQAFELGQLSDKKTSNIFKEK